jgi:large subunit ribosomal protein L2
MNHIVDNLVDLKPDVDQKILTASKVMLKKVKKKVKDNVRKNKTSRNKPFSPLLSVSKRKGGRNNQGRITVRHQGGGHKRKYRIIDFKRDKENIKGRVERIEYDPNRSAQIALVLYQDGERRYILAPHELKVGSEIMSGEHASIATGNCLRIKSIPTSTLIHAIELKPGKGAQLARSAGAFVRLIARESGYATIQLRSGEIRKIPVECKASIGVVSNPDHALRKLRKAGSSRWRGIRPTVRGVAMNPVDHPHGGGEGKTSGGRHPVTPWGVKTKGFKTRNNKRTDAMIIKHRTKKRK